MLDRVWKIKGKLNEILSISAKWEIGEVLSYFLLQESWTQKGIWDEMIEI